MQPVPNDVVVRPAPAADPRPPTATEGVLGGGATVPVPPDGHGLDGFVDARDFNHARAVQQTQYNGELTGSVVGYAGYSTFALRRGEGRTAVNDFALAMDGTAELERRYAAELGRGSSVQSAQLLGIQLSTARSAVDDAARAAQLGRNPSAWSQIQGLYSGAGIAFER